MKCQAKISNLRYIGERQCKREASIGIFCICHPDYIEKIKKRINELQEELKRIKSIR